MGVQRLLRFVASLSRTQRVSVSQALTVEPERSTSALHNKLSVDSAGIEQSPSRRELLSAIIEGPTTLLALASAEIYNSIIYYLF